MTTYLLPTTPANDSGGQPAHISQAGFALCGATVPASYIASEYLLSWNLCKTCRHIRAAGLLDGGEDERKYDGVRVA